MHERKTDFRNCLRGRKGQNQFERIRKINISNILICKTDAFNIQMKPCLEMITQNLFRDNSATTYHQEVLFIKGVHFFPEEEIFVALKID